MGPTASGILFLWLLGGCIVLSSQVFSPLGGILLNSRVARDLSNDERPDCMPGAVAPPTRINTSRQLQLLREKMDNHNVQAYIVLMDDAHQSEYVADSDKRVQFLSGFSGSAGRIAVLRDKAALWSDGRYFLQMDAELDCNWMIMKEGQAGIPSLSSWLISELSEGDRVGADPEVLSYDSWMDYMTVIEREDLVMESMSSNLVDAVWADVGGRPPMPNNPLFVLGLQYTGKTWQDKLAEIRADMTIRGVGAVVVTALDENAWLFNMRGSDVAYNPVFFSYTIIEDNKVTLYLGNYMEKLTDAVQSHLKVPASGVCSNNADCVNVKDYGQFFIDLDAVVNTRSDLVWSSPMSSYAVFSSLGANEAAREAKAYLTPSLLREMKGRKNSVEVESMRNCHKTDSAVLIQFLAILEKEVKEGKHWSEMSASDRLEEMRRAEPLNRGLSFATISGVGSNGAIIHYKASEATNKNISTTEMYLLDSGGQYLDGTTDVTRTFHFGTPTDTEKEAYTRVLMGSINLAMAVWPSGTYGRDLDILAREPLWSVGWNYRHGTGHGLGMFLNVHEGPGRINMGYREKQYESPLYGEMFFSDEPGYYEDGEFGIRLETIVMTKRVMTEHEFGDQDYLGFEEFTLVPFEPNLIKYELLTAPQRRWLNAYNERCLKDVGEVILRDVRGDVAAYEWVVARTEPISELPTLNTASLTVPSLIIILTSFLLA